MKPPTRIASMHPSTAGDQLRMFDVAVGIAGNSSPSEDSAQRRLLVAGFMLKGQAPSCPDCPMPIHGMRAVYAVTPSPAVALRVASTLGFRSFKMFSNRRLIHSSARKL